MNFLFPKFRIFQLAAFLIFTGFLARPGFCTLDIDMLELPVPGDHALRVITPTVLELVLINTKAPDPGRLTQWDFVDAANQVHLPATTELVVTANGRQIGVKSVGFRRRPLYAPDRKRDLRLGNSLYLTLSGSVADNETVAVTNPNQKYWSPTTKFEDVADPLRWSPAIHVNQVGYMPGFSKVAMIGYQLSDLGEISVSPTVGFYLSRVSDRSVAFRGQLTSRPDVGFSITPLPYQNVLEADFSAFNVPGEYWLVVPGLGASYPFQIHDGIAGAAARAYALGIYHQRCGTSNDLPYTRFVHDDCHTAPAEVPTATNPTWQYIAAASADYASNPQFTAPQLKSLATCYFPFNRQGTVDVSGGHHDAGDYSKYTINSAMFIHALVFAADSFANVGALDNLGIPESGDGKSDILQEAKWEADFLAKMQDTDGGFYFLVYPRDNKYEWDVLPDHGYSQVVWPKTTSVTASSVGALAQIASSPLFKQQFPVEAATYLQKAKLGWDFLERAIAKYGKDGAYQKITHYGNGFGHDDELTWAAASMFIATGDPRYQQKLMEWLPDPTDPTTRVWSWWYLFEGYGCAIRNYAFAVRSGRLPASAMNAAYLAKCESEVRAAGQAVLSRTQNSAYGTAFSAEAKRYLQIGWYFSSDQAFDMTVAYQLDPNPSYIDAVIENLNYELGCNPININYVTGLGWHRQREIVHQYAQNDRRILPPSGIPTGNLQNTFMYLTRYVNSDGNSELRTLTYPLDYGADPKYYPYYDRWADSYNVNTEMVNVNQSRSLASLAFLFTKTSLKSQTWRTAFPQITGVPSQTKINQPVTAAVTVPGMDLSQATVVWEATGQEPTFGNTFTFTPTNSGPNWIEAEVQQPDGRRVSAALDFTVGSTTSTNSPPTGGGGGTTNTPPPTATTVIVHSYDDMASAVTNSSGSFTIIRSGITGTLNVDYTMSGTAINGLDYNLLSGVATLVPGQSSILIPIVPTAHSLSYASQTAIMTLTAGTNYTIVSPITDTVTITGNPSTTPPPPPPPTIPQTGLQVWLKGDAGVSTDISNYVNSWADQSPNRNNATQAGSARPLWVASAINGQPALRFDGAIDCMTIPHKAGLNFSDLSFFAAVAFRDTASVQALFAKDEGGGPVNKWIYWFLSGTMDMHVQPGGIHGSSIGFTPPANKVTILEMVKQGGNYIHYQNGSGLGTTPTSPSLPIINADLTIGQAEGHYFLNGDLAEVLMYNTAISTSQRQTIENYLMVKYGLKAPSTPPPPDTQPPSAPTNLKATLASSSQVNLSWNVAADNVGTTAYRIYRNGTQITSTTGRSYSDTTILPDTNYIYSVVAVDASGNLSVPSTTVTILVHDTDGDGIPDPIDTYPTDYYNAIPPVLRIAGGNNQKSGAPNTFLPLPLKISVTSITGVPLPRAPITFTVQQGTGRISLTPTTTTLTTSISTLTDSTGNAQVYFLPPGVSLVTDRVAATAGPLGNTTQILFTENMSSSDLPQNGLSLWMKADEGVSKDANGYVSNWTDLSSGANHAVQPVASARPRWFAAVANGNPAVRFDGLDDFLSSGNKAQLNFNDMSIFVMVAFRDVGAVQALVSKDEGGGPVNKWIYWYLSGVMDLHEQPGNVHATSAPLSSAAGTVQLVEFIKSGSTYSHGLNTQNMGTVTTSATLPVANSDLRIGQAEDHNFLNGDIAEILIYNRAISASEKQTIETYLTNKYKP